jgi:predicted porin
MKLGKCASLGTLAVLPLYWPLPPQAAESDSVQLYGIVGAVIANDTVTYAGKRYTRSGPRSDLSVYELKGKHDLGDGVALDFQLENGFSSMTGEGGSRIWGRGPAGAVTPHGWPC